MTLIRKGTCVVVFRIAKDLGDHVLPYRKRHASKSHWMKTDNTLGGRFQRTSQAPPSFSANWPDIVEPLLDLHLYCVQRRGAPAWSQVSEAGVLLMLPKDSVMKQRWSHRPSKLGNANIELFNITLTS